MLQIVVSVGTIIVSQPFESKRMRTSAFPAVELENDVVAVENGKVDSMVVELWRLLESVADCFEVVDVAVKVGQIVAMVTYVVVRGKT